MRLATYKVGIRKSGTNLLNVGAGTAPQTFNVLETEVGARPTSGAEINIKDFASSGETVNVGDIVKYVNLFIQVCPRLEQGAPLNHVGWLEWAFVMVKESETTVPITNLGVQTLAVVCTNMFRNECIYTGAVPTGTTQGNYLAIQIKVPKFKQKIRMGDEWRLITSFRSSLSTDVTTDTIRLVRSFMYKCYS